MSDISTIEIGKIMLIKPIEKSEHAREIYEMIIRPTFNVVEEIEREYDNGGLSFVALLEESTLSFHYYPEFMSATVMVSTCDRNNAIDKFRDIIAKLMMIYEIHYKIFEIKSSGLYEYNQGSDIVY